MTDIVFSAIGTLGFPIFVAIYLLTTLKKSMDSNTKVLRELSGLIAELCRGK